MNEKKNASWCNKNNNKNNGSTTVGVYTNNIEYLKNKTRLNAVTFRKIKYADLCATLPGFK